MNKKIAWALVLMAVSAVVMIYNPGRVGLKLPFLDTMHVMQPLLYLVLIGDGVAIGLLLK